MSYQTHPHHPTSELEEDMFNDRLYGSLDKGAEKVGEDGQIITAIEARIAEENPSLEGMDITSLASKDMVRVAEMGIADHMEPSFVKQALELAVTEGARQQQGKEYSNGENPITSLTLHGYEQQVMEVIEDYATRQPASPEMIAIAEAAVEVLRKTGESAGVQTGDPGSVEALLDNHVE